MSQPTAEAEPESYPRLVPSPDCRTRHRGECRCGREPSKVVMARPAQIAFRSRDEGNTVACSKVPYVASDLHHPAAELVSLYSRQLQLDSEPGPMVLPHVPVASADTAVRFRLDDGIARPGLRVRKVCTSSGSRIL